ncbi:MAG: putative rane protein, partial [Polyangiaceae bacterium]|nr:putative rane protein [Polyangiaceae bacterium]
AKSGAALDVGWVGAVADFTVVDLAGVTDPRVALLRGGHTSKRIDDALLRSRDVDALVLLAPPHEREVERRVRLLPSAEGFRVVAELPFAGGQRYLVLRKP